MINYTTLTPEQKKEIHEKPYKLAVERFKKHGIGTFKRPEKQQEKNKVPATW